MTPELTARNIQALAQALRDLDARVHEATAALKESQSRNAQLEQRLSVAEQHLAVMRVTAMGRGPTT